MTDRERAVVILKWIQAKRPDLIPADSVIRVATDDEDRHHATDAVVSPPGGAPIGVGFREMQDFGPRKFKLRYESEGYRTEVEKIQAGEGCRWYLNYWYDKHGPAAVSLIDVESMRVAGWLTYDKIHDSYSWRGYRPDPQTAMIYRFHHWVRNDGYVLFEHSWPRETEPFAFGATAQSNNTASISGAKEAT